MGLLGIKAEGSSEFLPRDDNLWPAAEQCPGDQRGETERCVPAPTEGRAGSVSIAVKPYFVARCSVGPISRLRLSAQLITPTWL